MKIKYILAALAATVFFNLHSQNEEKFNEFVQLETKRFMTAGESPLIDEDFNKFESLNYFEYNPTYAVKANWVLTPDETPIEMATSTDRTPMYIKVGEFHFGIGEDKFILSAYQSHPEPHSDERFKNPIFIPFNDLTNGVTSYGGGRYMDMDMPRDSEVTLDLNMTYHPYCAYNHRYSCPIPPAENVLEVEILAGVKVGVNGLSPEPSPDSKFSK
jgi:uncharacterized protein (DUF1684 family)